MSGSGLTILVLATLLSMPAMAEEGSPPAPGIEAEAVESADETDKEAAEYEALEGEHERELRRSELYARGDYTIAGPGERPVSNFYSLRGFQGVDPSCYAGVLTLETESWIPLAGESKFHAVEQIRVRPARTRDRFAHRHEWELYSDPIEMMGVVSTSEGSGGGTARVWLALNMEYNIYRLVTDVRPRVGTYEISTTGGGLARHKTEDFHFYFGDHHYAYVDLSVLEAARGAPGVQSALNDIRTLLSTRPPNVYMGYFDWARDEDGVSEGELQIDDAEDMRLGWGVKMQGQRRISIRIFCDAIIRQYERRWGRR